MRPLPAAALAPAYLYGRELEIAVLFCDMRGFTAFAEKRRPFDTVFLLNRYFLAMGRAVERAGGYVDKFLGDGVMALFGIGADPRAASRAALDAARAMSLACAELNQQRLSEFAEPIRIGIGIHLGPAIIGELGYGRAMSLTAIGDTVNIASRLETLTKDYAAQLVVSEPVARTAGISLDAFPAHVVHIRGRAQPLAVRAIDDARELPTSEPSP